jgi:hypothetical protein
VLVALAVLARCLHGTAWLRRATSHVDRTPRLV